MGGCLVWVSPPECVQLFMDLHGALTHLPEGATTDPKEGMFWQVGRWVGGWVVVWFGCLLLNACSSLWTSTGRSPTYERERPQTPRKGCFGRWVGGWVVWLC